MKLHGIALLAMVAATPVCRGVEMTLPEQIEGPAAATLIVPVHFSSASSGPISGIQFDLDWDESALVVSVVLGDSPQAGEKEMHSAELSGNSARHLIIGANRKAIADDVLVRVLILVKRTTAAGEYNLKLSNVLATDADGTSIPGNSAVLRIAVTGGENGTSSSATPARVQRVR